MKGIDERQEGRLIVLTVLLAIAGMYYRPFLASLTNLPPLLLSKSQGEHYQAAVLGLNYFDFGYVRRGLGGSLAYLISSDLRAATILFHLVCSASFVSLGFLRLCFYPARPLVLGAF